jgi:hypothetical protein
MLTQEQERKYRRTDRTEWISLQTRTLNFPVADELRAHEGDKPVSSKPAPSVSRLFEQTQQTPLLLAERFPRLTFFAIALAILLSALTTEIDYLRGAGYHW